MRSSTQEAFPTLEHSLHQLDSLARTRTSFNMGLIDFRTSRPKSPWRIMRNSRSVLHYSRSRSPPKPQFRRGLPEIDRTYAGVDTFATSTAAMAQQLRRNAALAHEGSQQTRVRPRVTRHLEKIRRMLDNGLHVLMIHWWAYQQDDLRDILLANHEKYTSGFEGMEEILGIDEPIKARYYTECYGTVEYENEWKESRDRCELARSFWTRLCKG